MMLRKKNHFFHGRRSLMVLQCVCCTLCVPSMLRFLQFSCCCFFVVGALKNGSSSAMYLLKDQAPQIRVKSSPRLLGCRSLPLRHFGSLRSPMIKHVFGNELRHHCLRCGHDQNEISVIHVSLVPFLSVRSCRFQMRLSCLVTRNLTPQETTFLLHGPN